jgi:hypothetical protein
MQGSGLFITLQQLRMKVIKLTQIKPTPICNRVPNARLGLFITLQQLRMKVIKLTQIKPTPICNRVPNAS